MKILNWKIVILEEPTEAPTSSETSNNSSKGKVPTGDSTSITILVSLIMFVSGTVVVSVARKKITSK